MLGHGPLDDAFVHEHLHYVYSLVGATLPEVIRQMAPPADRIT